MAEVYSKPSQVRTSDFEGRYTEIDIAARWELPLGSDPLTIDRPGACSRRNQRLTL